LPAAAPSGWNTAHRSEVWQRRPAATAAVELGPAGAVVAGSVDGATVFTGAVVFAGAVLAGGTGARTVGFRVGWAVEDAAVVG
jgi:hypothetical protein